MMKRVFVEILNKGWRYLGVLNSAPPVLWQLERAGVRARDHLWNLRGTRLGGQSDSSSQCDTVDTSKPRNATTVVAVNCSDRHDTTVCHIRESPSLLYARPFSLSISR